MVISLPLSRFGLSVGQFSVLGIWLIDGKYREKLKLLLSNKAALVLISFYFLHLLGLFYSSDFQYAFKDIRVKLPLLFLPIVFATTKPLSKVKTNQILLFYVAAVVISSLISFGVYLFGDVSNFRDLSPFISHIRLSLNVCLAIFLAGYFAFINYPGKRFFQVLFVGTILWLAVFLILIESVTGYIILIVAGYVLLIRILFRAKQINLKLSILIVIFALPFSLGHYIDVTVSNFLVPHKNDLANLEQYTPQGNAYYHDTINLPVENGSYVGLYICEEEMRSEWNKRSKLDYDGNDLRNQEIKYTLMRYLNSKDLRKDADGVIQLNEEDISNIEKGIANYFYTKRFSINTRFYRLLWEYQIVKQNGNPGGHSIIQRFEFWKVSLAIIKDNFWIGVGTGDINQAFIDKYQEMDSVLKKEWRHRSHNQFLAVFVTFGIIGFLWFLLSLIYPALKLKKFDKYMYFMFWITMIISMLVEDTLETQMGVTLYAFFNAYLLFGVKEE